jgi:hypothetical protein
MNELEIIITICVQALTLMSAIRAFIQLRKNSTAIQEIHLTLNSRLSELLNITEKSAHAAGKLEGLADKTESK